MLVPQGAPDSLIQPVDVFIDSGSIPGVEEDHLERMVETVAAIEQMPG